MIHGVSILKKSGSGGSGYRESYFGRLLYWVLQQCFFERKQGDKTGVKLGNMTVFTELPLLFTPLAYIQASKAAIGQKSTSAYQKMWLHEVYLYTTIANVYYYNIVINRI
ncbi:MAG: hypothetical protein CVV06_00920 [Gammaproteobacteria bacterium HGW-Gammaproteobacteria-10]|nr:MAG: hypothetical protein CVV06_00920 [Gammaproteobacteria bacterium HGW-Gammaproteobacteria-10]